MPMNRLSFPILSRRLIHFVLGSVLAAVVPVQAAGLDAAPEASFTIVVIPDTQGYRGQGTKHEKDSTDPVTNPVFKNHVRWIKENLEGQRIIFVSHVGDIVDKNMESQWTVARECMDELHGVVPYSIVVGNHDMKASGDSSLFQKFFGEERFRDFPWYGEAFKPERPTSEISGNNANSYQLFSAEGLDFIHISLECNAPDDVLEWAGGLMTKHASRRALITTHMDLGIREKPKTTEGYIKDPKGRMNWTKNHGSRGNTAEQMWDKLYSKHANLGFVFCGDQSRCSAMKRSTEGDHGNMVHALLSDYTSSGPLRLYRFLPAENKVQVITYDTTLNEVVETSRYVETRSEHQFSLPYPMKP
jgi:hypothetical protein